MPAAIAKDPVVKVTLMYTDRIGPAIQKQAVVAFGQATRSDNTATWHVVDYPVENDVEQVVLVKPGTLTKIAITANVDRITQLDDTQGFAVVWRVEGTA